MNVSKQRRWLFGIPLLALCASSAVLGFLPADEDPPLALAVPSAARGESFSAGFRASWPDLPTVNPDQAALGRLLFYDPILSGSNDIACASCHHPDLGFADGLAVSQGHANQTTRRSAPSLWNVAFVSRLFWDGRSESLEAQVIEPLTAPNEMNADLDELLAELRGIPDYEREFAAVFPDGLTLANVQTAIAAFERTLISNESAFDRYVAGDFNALTPSQRRGFDLFRSTPARCIECHSLPTFSDDQFHVLGVPNLDINHPDRGRGEIADDPLTSFAFRTPTLRNIALTAPYMHNGTFATLDDVIDFYESGGNAPGIDAPIDHRLTGFRLTDQQTSDLVDFLHALTDEPAGLTEIPNAVPSGLPVVMPLANPARGRVEATMAVPVDGQETRQPQTIVVAPGERLQPAVDRARPGDTVLVEPGTYYETIAIDTPDVTIRGVIRGEDRPWIDGQNARGDGFAVRADGVVLDGLGARNFLRYGVVTVAAERGVVRDLMLENAGVDGLYAVEAADLVIEQVRATGMSNAGIYVSQSAGPVTVRDSTLSGNHVGIVVANSQIELYGNTLHGNSGGILVTLLNIPPVVSPMARIHDNVIEHNNRAVDRAVEARAGSPTAIVPAGTGILIASADATEVDHNTIRGNQTVGIGITSIERMGDLSGLARVGLLPEYNWLHDNVFAANGAAPQGFVADLGLRGGDIIWTGEGWSNAFDEPAVSRFPVILPGRAWPAPARRALWRVYDGLLQFRGER